MKVNISKITNAINKISDLTSGDKTIPGVLLDLSEDTLKVCYSDGHKSLVEKLSVEVEEGDYIGAIAVDFTQMARAIANCQPSGIIKVEEIRLEYKPNNIVTVSADQNLEVTDDEGNITQTKKLASKKMDLAWKEPGSDMKSAILTRMKYDDIFEADMTDEFDKKELVEALSKTSTEKGKQIYLSVKTQNIFVANQAHVTSVPISKLKELSLEEKDEIRAELNEAGTFTDENYKAEIEKAENRMHFSVAMSQTLSKSLIGILNKMSSDTVYLHTKDKCCNIFVDNEDETVGVWFEMAQASKAHTGSLERYSSMNYKTYQIMFLREFLANNVKSALNATKSEKVDLKFDIVDEELGLVIKAGSASSSVADTYRVVTYDVIDPTNDLTSKSFVISLKVLSDMLDQLKTTLVALDIEVGVEGTTCIRLAEVNDSKMTDEYNKAREETRKLCEARGEAFDSNSTPTPIELKLNYRINSIDTKQYTMLSK